MQSYNCFDSLPKTACLAATQLEILSNQEKDISAKEDDLNYIKNFIDVIVSKMNLSPPPAQPQIVNMDPLTSFAMRQALNSSELRPATSDFESFVQTVSEHIIDPLKKLVDGNGANVELDQGQLKILSLLCLAIAEAYSDQNSIESKYQNHPLR